jgi:hypothetical protein
MDCRVCMACETREASDARAEIIEGYFAILRGEKPPTNFAALDPPLPLSCCKRKPRAHACAHADEMEKLS